MAKIKEEDVYRLLGETGFARLVGAFYQQVPHDDILGPMYPKHDLAAAEHRLREFLIQRFGGPTRYSEARGHPRLRMRHAPFNIDFAARNRWIELMSTALRSAEVPAEVVEVLLPYFQNTATQMMNQD